MRRIQQLLIAVLFIVGVVSWGAGPQTGGFGMGGNPRPTAISYAAFQAFPASGAGLSGPCSTTAPTGARGQVLTFTRASTATCTKTSAGGLTLTGIANGDLVSVASNVARVQYNNGSLGLKTEDISRTNSVLQSQSFDNVYWTNDVTPTANFATAPDGNTTAQRYQFVATSGVTRSVAFVSGGCPAGAVPFAQSLYVRGTSGSGTMDLCAKDLSTSPCTPCSFVSTSWSRCIFSGTSASPGYFMFGNASQYNGGTSRSANDVLVWGGQCEDGAFVSSYIPTTTVTVNRPVQSAAMSSALMTTGSDFSFAQSFVSDSNLNACAGFFAISNASSGPGIYSCFTNSATFRAQSGGFFADSAATAFSAFKWNTGIRWGGAWNRATNISTAYTDGIAGTPSAATPTVTSTSWSAIQFLGMGIHTKVCADPSQTRCR